MTEERTYTYKPSMAEDKTHAACYHCDWAHQPCEGKMIYLPPVKANFPTKGHFGGHYSCQGHIYISWGLLAGWEELNSAKQVFPPIGRKKE